MVITSDFESENLSSILSRSFELNNIKLIVIIQYNQFYK